MAQDPKSAARERREQAAAAEAASARRTRNIQLLAGVVFVAIVVIVLAIALGGGKSRGGISPEGKASGTSETAALLDGIPQNGYTLGDPNAKLEIVEFMDLQCPYCQAHELDEQPTVIKEIVKPGIAKYRLLPLGFLGPDSETARTVMAHLAAKNRAWQFMNLFYWNQGEENTGYVTPSFLKTIAVAAGGTAADASTTRDAKVTAELREVDDLRKALLPDGPSTPTFAIGRSDQSIEDFKIIDTTQSSEPAGQQLVAALKALQAKAG